MLVGVEVHHIVGLSVAAMPGKRRALFVRQRLLGRQEIAAVSLLAEEGDGLADGGPYLEIVSLFTPLYVYGPQETLSSYKDVLNGGSFLDFLLELFPGGLLRIGVRVARRIDFPEFFKCTLYIIY